MSHSQPKKEDEKGATSSFVTRSISNPKKEDEKGRTGVAVIRSSDKKEDEKGGTCSSMNYSSSMIRSSPKKEEEKGGTTSSMIRSSSMNRSNPKKENEKGVSGSSMFRSSSSSSPKKEDEKGGAGSSMNSYIPSYSPGSKKGGTGSPMNCSSPGSSPGSSPSYNKEKEKGMGSPVNRYSPGSSPGSSPSYKKEKETGGTGSSLSRSSPKGKEKVPEGSIEMKSLYGIDHIILRNGRGVASARVSLHGGQVRSWITDRGEELLFTSSKTHSRPPKAVRGGIPICFPQYVNKGLLEQHGFARKKIWEIDKDPPPLPKDTEGKVFTDLLLKPSTEDLKIWQHSFEFRLRVSLAADGHLLMVSRIRNVDVKPFSFSIAFHTYLSVSDISEVRVEGLETLNYLDNLQDKKRFTEQGDALTFESEVDRVYVDTGNRIAVLDHEKKRTIVIEKEGLPDVVVWNPWEKKAKALEDLDKKEYKKMVCVDGAAVENPITLKPGQEWTGKLKLTLVRST